MGLVQSNQNWIVSSSSMIHECKSQKQLMQKLVFIETRNFNNQDLTLDNIDIFRLKQPPYESLMKSSRIFEHESSIFTAYCQNLKKLSENIVHKNIAPLHFVKIIHENNICIRNVKIQQYATYYGIDLRDIIQSRKSQDWRFTQGQILYVTKSLISFGSYLKKYKVSFGLYQSKNIFSSDNGYLKMYLFHVLPQNKHINYFHLLSIKPSTLSSYLPIAPEMFSQLQQNNLTPSFDFFKADLFSIGMILIDMIMENSLQRYYRISKDGMSFDQAKLRKDLLWLRSNSVYDQKIIYLLENILQVKPHNRWTFEQAEQYLEQLKKQIEFSCKLTLRLDHDKEEDCQTNHKISFKSQQPQSQYVLRSIQNSLQSKLNPLPLKSLSKLTSSKNNVSNQTLIHKSIYTRRRNTGVSIVGSSSSQHHNLSVSKRDDKTSKIITVRNSLIAQHIFKVEKVRESSQVQDFELKKYLSQKNSIPIKSQINDHYPQKLSENWLTLGSTRITEENSKTFSFLPPKASKAPKSNLKPHIYHINKQNQMNLRKENTINTHIKIHKKNVLSPRGKQQLALQLSTFSRIELQQKGSSSFRKEDSHLQKPSKTVRPKMKINQHLR